MEFFKINGGTMLTFNEKLAIIESFPQLTRKDVSLKRVNYQFEESAFEKKNVVYHLHPNGNGYVYAEFLEGYTIDEKGMANIRDFSADNLRTIIQKSIDDLSKQDVGHVETKALEEFWVNKSGQSLKLMHEYEMWNVYAGLNLDGTFNSYKEAAEYLDEEGFTRK
jgi:hypothetical protein